MIFKTYIIKNSLSNRYYIGSTNDLSRRLDEHNRGQTKSTNRKGVWELVYFEDFRTSIEAKIREKVLKSYKGGNAFKKLLRE
jgi:putative endonuclease